MFVPIVDENLVEDKRLQILPKLIAIDRNSIIIQEKINYVFVVLNFSL